MSRHLRTLLAPVSAPLHNPPRVPVPGWLQFPTPRPQSRLIHTASAQQPVSDTIVDDEEAAFDRLVANHPLLAAFRAESAAATTTTTPTPLNTNPLTPTDGIILSRSALLPSPAHVPYNLTCTTLSGPGLISPRPYVFTDPARGAVIAFYRLGRRLAGHSGLVHGGVLAAVLDECMCRACFGRLEKKIAVTARLGVEYKAPVRVGGVVVVVAETGGVEGRKAWVDARVVKAEEGEGGKVLVKAEGLFVEPRWAGEMDGIYHG
ncbi:HotDog domain-containing protein [Staphylotrichum tortipilum]|uniref:HotDog domain-containing protein n=1 Tax=Staphylotrichum tortipilum TaxID=2831512 RepID=A0AAN6RML6_9PEZI|nr:HotDog domain-containing protein [Staphylotrichum longicolle]